jgi:hypothetical protein
MLGKEVVQKFPVVCEKFITHKAPHIESLALTIWNFEVTF